MSVWFKYAGDKDITPGHPGGSSVFAPPAGGGGGFPAYGTVLSTAYGVDYDIGYDAYSTYLATLVKTQICDVNTVADGVGGSFVDWSSATMINYKSYGLNVAYGPNIWFYPIEVPTGSGNYYNVKKSDDSEEIHDGTGGLAIIPIGFDYLGTVNQVIFTFTVGQTVEIPPGSSQYWNNGLDDNYSYNCDGLGSYTGPNFTGVSGSLYPNGQEVDTSLRYNLFNWQSEIPPASGQFFDNGKHEVHTQFWDGVGGYYDDISPNSPTGSYYAYGTYIYNDGTYDYYWDGFGGYYI